MTVAFFDTSVHVAILRGTLRPEAALAEVGGRAVRLSPVVASELLRGASGRAARGVETLVAQLLPIEPPSWRSCWLEVGRLLRRTFPDYEAIGLARLQNHLILALAARHTGALLLTGDVHFEGFRRYVRFPMRRIALPRSPAQRK